MIDDEDGFDHHWVDCEEGCPSDLYCGKCSCGEYGCPIMCMSEGWSDDDL